MACLSLFNLIYALIIDRLTLTDTLKKAGSLCAVCSLILPLFLAVKGASGVAALPPIGMVGVLAFLISIVVLIIGALKTK